MKKKKLILIGSSTGGPGHLEKIISSLNTDFDATLIIAQHLDFSFLPSMIKRFDETCTHPVVQAHENEFIKEESITFTNKDISDLQFNPTKGLYFRKCTQNPFYQPSVNSLFFSASKLQASYDILACLLTGIGDDGAEGMLALKNSGARCISESEDSCIVYGMPKAAFELGASTEVMSLEKIITEINNF